MFTPVIDAKRRRGPYCGPTAIALLTGVPYSRIEKMIRRKRGASAKDVDGRNIPIKGTYPWEVRRILKLLGCKVTPVKVAPAGATTPLSRFVDDYRYAGTYLVEVTGHFMVCEKGLIADTTHQLPIPIEKYARSTRRVQAAWKVDAPALPKYSLEGERLLAEAAVARRKPKKDPQKKRAENALKLLKTWERKEKLAKTKLKKLRAQVKRYTQLGVYDAELVSEG